MRHFPLAGSALALLGGLLGTAPAQELGRRSALAIRSLDEALASLPPVDRERVWDPARRSWELDPAVAWLLEHLEKGGTLSDEQWRDALLRSRAIRVRERWPVELPLAVSMQVPSWLPSTVIRVDPEDPSLASAGAANVGFDGRRGHGRSNPERYRELGKLSLGKHALLFRASIQRIPVSSTGDTWSGTLSFPVEVVPTLDEALPPAHDEALDAAVRKAVEATLFHGTELIVRLDPGDVPDLATTAVSVEIELFEGTRSVGRHESAARWQLPPDASIPAWSIRIRGRPEEVLRFRNAERYWDGELAIPLSEVKAR